MLSYRGMHTLLKPWGQGRARPGSAQRSPGTQESPAYARHIPPCCTVAGAPHVLFPKGEGDYFPPYHLCCCYMTRITHVLGRGTGTWISGALQGLPIRFCCSHTRPRARLTAGLLWFCCSHMCSPEIDLPPGLPGPCRAQDAAVLTLAHQGLHFTPMGPTFPVWVTVLTRVTSF